MISSCKTNLQQSDSLFKLLSPEDTGVNFSNDNNQTDPQNVLAYMYFYNGAGVSLGNINNDGLTDVFLSGNMVSSRLYLNQGNFQNHQGRVQFHEHTVYRGDQSTVVNTVHFGQGNAQSADTPEDLLYPTFLDNIQLLPK